MSYLAVLSYNPLSLPDVAGGLKSGLGTEERATDAKCLTGRIRVFHELHSSMS